MRTKVKWAGVTIGLVIVGLQFTTPRHTNPPFDEAQTLPGMTAVPPDISALFTRSGNDCHSNKTNWRWYTYVAPVSWLTVMQLRNYIGSESAADFSRLCPLYPQTATLIRGSR